MKYDIDIRIIGGAETGASLGVSRTIDTGDPNWQSVVSATRPNNPDANALAYSIAETILEHEQINEEVTEAKRLRGLLNVANDSEQAAALNDETLERWGPVVEAAEAWEKIPLHAREYTDALWVLRVAVRALQDSPTGGQPNAAPMGSDEGPHSDREGDGQRPRPDRQGDAPEPDDNKPTPALDQTGAGEALPTAAADWQYCPSCGDAVEHDNPYHVVCGCGWHHEDAVHACNAHPELVAERDMLQQAADDGATMVGKKQVRIDELVAERDELKRLLLHRVEAARLDDMTACRDEAVERAEKLRRTRDAMCNQWRAEHAAQCTRAEAAEADLSTLRADVIAGHAYGHCANGIMRSDGGVRDGGVLRYECDTCGHVEMVIPYQGPVAAVERAESAAANLRTKLARLEAGRNDASQRAEDYRQRYYDQRALTEQIEGDCDKLQERVAGLERLQCEDNNRIADAEAERDNAESVCHKYEQDLESGALVYAHDLRAKADAQPDNLELSLRAEVEQTDAILAQPARAVPECVARWQELQDGQPEIDSDEHDRVKQAVLDWADNLAAADQSEIDATLAKCSREYERATRPDATSAPAAVLCDGVDVPFLPDLQADLRDLQADLRDGKEMTMRRGDNDTEAYLRAHIEPLGPVVGLVRACQELDPPCRLATDPFMDRVLAVRKALAALSPKLREKAGRPMSGGKSDDD